MTAHVESLDVSPEIAFQRSNVYLCLLVNRAQQAVRIIDFRAGPSPEKREVIEGYARQHGLSRLYTLVERDEVSGWTRLGFAREGTIPGFYKRSDAYLLGRLIGPSESPRQSGTRPAVARASGIALATSLEDQYQAARKLSRAWPQVQAGMRVATATAAEARGLLAEASAKGPVLTHFEPFSRDAERSYYVCSGRGVPAVLLSVESQACFNNAYLEAMSLPGSEKEGQVLSRSLAGVCRLLKDRGTVSCFAIAPAASAEVGAAYLKAGFRRTGILKGHLRSGEGRQDAFLWTRKLALPDDA